jgi:hypothetical protein
VLFVIIAINQVVGAWHRRTQLASPPVSLNPGHRDSDSERKRDDDRCRQKDRDGKDGRWWNGKDRGHKDYDHRQAPEEGLSPRRQVQGPQEEGGRLPSRGEGLPREG